MGQNQSFEYWFKGSNISSSKYEVIRDGKNTYKNDSDNTKYLIYPNGMEDGKVHVKFKIISLEKEIGLGYYHKYDDINIDKSITIITKSSSESIEKIKLEKDETYEIFCDLSKKT